MNDIDELPARLTFQRDGFTYLRPCLDVTIYWSGSPFERGDELVDFYRQSMDLIKGDIKFFRTEAMTAARPLKKDTFDLVPFWFQKTSTKRDVYMLFLESGSVADEPSDRAFALNASPDRGYIRLVLPISSIKESVASYSALAASLGGALKFDFGQAGLALNWNNLAVKYKKDALRAMNSLASRYPGIDMSHPFSTKYVVTKGIKCVNWLTFLNETYCERLGGVAKLSKALGEDVLIQTLNSGIVIQAGSAPEAGDVNRQQSPAAYHRAGRALATIRTREHPPIFGPNGIADKEATDKWLARFDS